MTNPSKLEQVARAEWEPRDKSYLRGYSRAMEYMAEFVRDAATHADTSGRMGRVLEIIAAHCDCSAVLYRDGVICEVRDFNDDMADASGHAPSPEQKHANKLLISAAPDMLEALSACASILPRYNMAGKTAGEDEELDAVFERVLEALEKANGPSHAQA